MNQDGAFNNLDIAALLDLSSNDDLTFAVESPFPWTTNSEYRSAHACKTAGKPQSKSNEARVPYGRSEELLKFSAKQTKIFPNKTLLERLDDARAKTLTPLLILIVACNFSQVSLGQQDQTSAWVESKLETLAKLYLHFHRKPELSFEEQETATRFAEELERMGADVSRNIGGHGVVAIIENGPGPTVMLRADLDALPIKEQTNLPYASTVRATDAAGNEVGVMHACGHDLHMACLIGAAGYLAANQDQWSGRLMLVGQPAEERGSGATAMLQCWSVRKIRQTELRNRSSLQCNGPQRESRIALRIRDGECG